MIELDIDGAQLKQIADEFAASEKDLRRAFSRALSRTSRTLRTQARKDLRAGLELRAASVLKARLRLKRYKARGARLGSAMLWVGTNDMAADAFKGKPRETASGARVGSRAFEGAFVGTSRGSGRSMVFKRRGRKRLPIYRETVPVADDMQEIMERQVFDQAQRVLIKNFRAELRARTIYNVG